MIKKRNDFQAWDSAFSDAATKFLQRKTFVLRERPNDADFLRRFFTANVCAEPD
jgi:hypothetical protein